MDEKWTLIGLTCVIVALFIADRVLNPRISTTERWASYESPVKLFRASLA
jgi:hypothetical protein